MKMREMQLCSYVVILIISEKIMVPANRLEFIITAKGMEQCYI